MASFAFGNSNGVLNGTTQVDIAVAPPASTQRGVNNVTFFNRDTAPVTVTLKLSDAGTLRFLDQQTIQPNQAWLYSVLKVLDTTTKKLVAVMSGAPATTNPDFDAAWADNT
jgi:hypothetical protein